MLKDASSFIIILVSFFISVILGPMIIPRLESLGVGQSIREEGPESHMSKQGTATMGGLIIVASLILSLIVFGIDFLSSEIIIILTAILGFGLIGFIDDYIIVVRKDNQGLTSIQKIILQTGLALLLSLYHFKTSSMGGKMIIPFVKYKYLDLGIFYPAFMTFVMVGTVNSVNLTDGLDGLASGVTMIVMTFFASISEAWGVKNVADLSYALAGSCLGFLVHNSNPAKIFMGDTGSLALGGAVASIAMVLNLPLIIPIVGGIYLIEALSVIIQVVSFKTRGKRVFLMSPLHHHYEEKGWKETKVVKVFWSMTLLLTMIGYLALK